MNNIFFLLILFFAHIQLVYGQEIATFSYNFTTDGSGSGTVVLKDSGETVMSASIAYSPPAPATAIHLVPDNMSKVISVVGDCSQYFSKSSSGLFISKPLPADFNPSQPPTSYDCKITFARKQLVEVYYDIRDVDYVPTSNELKYFGYYFPGEVKIPFLTDLADGYSYSINEFFSDPGCEVGKSYTVPDEYSYCTITVAPIVVNLTLHPTDPDCFTPVVKTYTSGQPIDTGASSVKDNCTYVGILPNTNSAFRCDEQCSKDVSDGCIVGANSVCTDISSPTFGACQTEYRKECFKNAEPSRLACVSKCRKSVSSKSGFRQGEEEIMECPVNELNDRDGCSDGGASFFKAKVLNKSSGGGSGGSGGSGEPPKIPAILTYFPDSLYFSNLPESARRGSRVDTSGDGPTCSDKDGPLFLENVVLGKPLVLNYGLFSEGCPGVISFDISGESYYLTNSFFSYRGAGDFTWFGKSGDDSVVLSFFDGKLTADIPVGGHYYSVAGVDGGHIVSDNTNTRMPVDVPSLLGEPSDEPPYSGQDGQRGGTRQSGNIVIDILVAYTSKSSAADARTAVDLLNSAYKSSGVNITFNLVHSVHVDYSEIGWGDLDNLRGKTDGFMDDIHQLRKEYGADIVSLLASPPEPKPYAGLSYMMNDKTFSKSFAKDAFSVVDPQFIQGPTYAFTHEISHNLGSAHDQYAYFEGSEYGDVGCQGRFRGVYPYSCGYINIGSGTTFFSTVMSYDTKCVSKKLSCPRINLLSSPDVMYLGVPTGDSGADNAESARNTAGLVASFYSSSDSGSVPTTPSGITSYTSASSFAVDTEFLDEETQIFALFNGGDENLTVSISFLDKNEEPVNLSSWLTFVEPLPVPPHGTSTFPIVVDFTKAPPGNTTYKMVIESNGGDVVVPLVVDNLDPSSAPDTYYPLEESLQLNVVVGDSTFHAILNPITLEPSVVGSIFGLSGYVPIVDGEVVGHVSTYDPITGIVHIPLATTYVSGEPLLFEMSLQRQLDGTFVVSGFDTVSATVVPDFFGFRQAVKPNQLDEQCTVYAEKKEANEISKGDVALIPGRFATPPASFTEKFITQMDQVIVDGALILDGMFCVSRDVDGKQVVRGLRIDDEELKWVPVTTAGELAIWGVSLIDESVFATFEALGVSRNENAVVQQKLDEGVPFDAAVAAGLTDGYENAAIQEMAAVGLGLVNPVKWGSEVARILSETKKPLKEILQHVGVKSGAEFKELSEHTISKVENLAKLEILPPLKKRTTGNLLEPEAIVDMTKYLEEMRKAIVLANEKVIAADKVMKDWEFKVMDYIKAREEAVKVAGSVGYMEFDISNGKYGEILVTKHFRHLLLEYRRVLGDPNPIDFDGILGVVAKYPESSPSLGLPPIQVINVGNTDVVNYTYVGRNAPHRSPLRNIYRIGVDGTREEVIAKFQTYLADQYYNGVTDEAIAIRNAIDDLVERRLKGENISLGCHCKPLPCHGDVIAAFVDTVALSTPVASTRASGRNDAFNFNFACEEFKLNEITGEFIGVMKKRQEAYNAMSEVTKKAWRAGIPDPYSDDFTKLMQMYEESDDYPLPMEIWMDQPWEYSPRVGFSAEWYSSSSFQVPQSVYETAHLNAMELVGKQFDELLLGSVEYRDYENAFYREVRKYISTAYQEYRDFVLLNSKTFAQFNALTDVEKKTLKDRLDILNDFDGDPATVGVKRLTPSGMMRTYVGSKFSQAVRLRNSVLHDMFVTRAAIGQAYYQLDVLVKDVSTSVSDAYHSYSEAKRALNSLLQKSRTYTLIEPVSQGEVEAAMATVDAKYKAFLALKADKASDSFNKKMEKINQLAGFIYYYQRRYDTSAKYLPTLNKDITILGGTPDFKIEPKFIDDVAKGKFYWKVSPGPEYEFGEVPITLFSEDAVREAWKSFKYVPDKNVYTYMKTPVITFPATTGADKLLEQLEGDAVKDIKKLAIVGPRSLGAEDAFEKVLMFFDPHYFDSYGAVISGGAVGADTSAELLADFFDIPKWVFLPDYKKFASNPKIAPLIRNGKIAETADMVLVIGRSDMAASEHRGTTDMINKALAAGKPVNFFDVDTGAIKGIFSPIDKNTGAGWPTYEEMIALKSQHPIRRGIRFARRL